MKYVVTIDLLCVNYEWFIEMLPGVRANPLCKLVGIRLGCGSWVWSSALGVVGTFSF